MARASFTLRVANGNLPATAGNYPLLAGSYLQYPPTYASAASAQSYLSLPGIDTNYATVPPDALNLTGDIEIVFRMRANSTLVSAGVVVKNGAYRVINDGTDATKLQMGVWNGTGWTNVNSNTGLVSVGTWRWYRVRRTSASAVSFDYAADQATEPTTWTSAGSGATASLTPPVSASSVEIGSRDGGLGGTNSLFKRVIIRNLTTGNSALDIDFTQSISFSGQKSLLASTGQTVTVNGTSATTVFLTGLRATGLDDGYLKGTGVLQ